MTIQKVTDEVYIGDVCSLQNQEVRERLNIKAVLNCAYELAIPRFTPKDANYYLCLKLFDGEAIPQDKIEIALEFIYSAERLGMKVLVACVAGASRSASIVLAYLVSKGYDINDALYKLQKIRPIVNPCPECIDSIKEYFNIEGY